MAKRRGNNEGSITLHSSGLYMARITVGRNPDGSPKRKTFYDKDKKELQKQIRQILRDIDLGLYVDNKNMTVGEWLDIWLWQYKKQECKAKTLESYEQVIRCYLKPALGNIMLEKLRPDQVQKMLNDLKERIPERALIKIEKLQRRLKKANNEEHDRIKGEIEKLKQERISSRTIRYSNVVLHGALEQALKNGLVTRNVSEAVTLPKQEKKEIRVLTKSEQNELIDTLKNDRLGALFMLSLATGLRCAELLGLRWEDVNLKEGYLEVKQILHRVKNFDPNADKKTKVVIETPKSKKSRRVVPLLKDVVKMLETHKKRQLAEKLKAGDMYQDIGYVFTNQLGAHLDARKVSERFYMLLDKSGIEKTGIHCLRHSFATRGLEQGIELKVMQELLGHSTFTLTADTYSHVLPEKKKESMNKLKGVFSKMV